MHTYDYNGAAEDGDNCSQRCKEAETVKELKNVWCFFLRCPFCNLCQDVFGSVGRGGYPLTWRLVVWF